ncbi:MAG: META domain-containing protein [Deferribacteraceae bacterium]|jgi:heat shock protein HslJ|nr:META domain-containing protein [Deferribacteraceae bacterium]
MKKLILCVFAVMLAACATKSTPAETLIATDADLVHHRYDLVAINDQQIETVDNVRQPRVEFNEGMQISGIVCNSFSGVLTLTDGSYQGMVAATRMACFDETLSKAEEVLFKALSTGADFEITGNEMSITHEGETLHFILNDYK